MTNYITRAIVLAMGVLACACTITDTTPPPVTGPSEMSLSLAINATPDVITEGSQSVITIDARDPNGQPVPNQLLYIEIAGGDYGAISHRTIVTNGSGRATVTYTAPSDAASDTVTILVRPSGTDNANAFSRAVSIRLNPSGTIPTGAPNPVFTFLPEAPAAFETVRFDGRSSTAPRGTSIAGYSWDFGDGETGTGSVVTHAYAVPGSYAARLTVTDSLGVSATSVAQVVEVGAGNPPLASFVFSPEQPVAGQSVFFNATTSVAGAGHRIVSYRWIWGDNSTSQGGVTRTHTFSIAGNFVVTLTVTDEAGQTSTTTQTVAVGP